MFRQRRRSGSREAQSSASQQAFGCPHARLAVELEAKVPGMAVRMERSRASEPAERSESQTDHPGASPLAFVNQSGGARPFNAASSSQKAARTDDPAEAGGDAYKHAVSTRHEGEDELGDDGQSVSPAPALGATGFGASGAAQPPSGSMPLRSTSALYEGNSVEKPFFLKNKFLKKWRKLGVPVEPPGALRVPHSENGVFSDAPVQPGAFLLAFDFCWA